MGHTHSVYANLAACSQETEAILKDALNGADYRFAVVPYVNPGTTLTFTIQDILENNGRPEVLVMQNHGVIVHHDEEARCLQIHEDMNRQLAAFFDLAEGAFPRWGSSPLSGAALCRTRPGWRPGSGGRLPG